VTLPTLREGRGPGDEAALLYICEFAEILVIFVVPSFTFADTLSGIDKFNGPYPFDHFEAELIFHAQPQRGTVKLAEGSVIHLVGEQGERAAGISQGKAVIKFTALGTLAKGVEDTCLHPRFWPGQFYNFSQEHSAPFSDAGPTLDAMVQGDLRLPRHGPEIDQGKIQRVFHLAENFEAVVSELLCGQLLPFV